MAPFRTVCSKLLPVCDHPPAPGAAKGGFRAPNQTRDRNEPDIETTGGSATPSWSAISDHVRPSLHSFVPSSLPTAGPAAGPAAGPGPAWPCPLALSSPTPRTGRPTQGRRLWRERMVPPREGWTAGHFRAGVLGASSGSQVSFQFEVP